MITLRDFFILHGQAVGQERTVMPFHDLIFARLTQVILGQLPNGKKNLAICMPPRHGKTLISQDFLLFTMGLFPNSNNIIISYSSDLALRTISAVRNVIQEKWYTDLFGTLVDSSCINKADLFTTRMGGQLYSAGIGGGIAGYGAGVKNQAYGGCIILDDVLKSQDAKSNTEREKVNTLFTDSIISRTNTTNTPIILIMQRLHKYDLVGYLEENFEDDWEFLQIPAIGNDGKAIWEETFSLKKLNRLKEINPHAFYSQYMQAPIIEGGQVIKPEWFKYYSSLPEGLNRMFITSDTAMKMKERSDYSVLSCWATNGINLYHIATRRGKWEAHELLEQAVVFWDDMSKEVVGLKPREFYIEDKASGTGLIQTLQNKTNIPVFGVQVAKDKLQRVKDVLPYIVSGRLWFRESASALCNQEIISECMCFTDNNTHLHDDIVDTITMALKLSIADGTVSIYDVLD